MISPEVSAGRESVRAVDRTSDRPVHRAQRRAPTESGVRVLIVDDHALYRRGLEVVLSQEPDLDGIEACRAIRELAPSTRIIMLTTSDDEHDLFESIRAGANGYLLKDVPPEEVIDGIRAVQAGQSLISPSLASTLLTEFAAMLRATHGPGAAMPAPRLTERELEVLRLVAQGMGNRDIAKALVISENTVKNHVRNILEKLQLHSRIEAAMYAVRERIVEPPPR